MACFYTFVLIKKCVYLYLKKNFKRGSKNSELDEMGRNDIETKGSTVIELEGCQWWRLSKTTNIVDQHIPENFTFRRSLATEQLIKEAKRGGNYLASFNVTLKYLKQSD